MQNIVSIIPQALPLSEQPFFIDDLSKLDIKDRKIDLGTLRALPKKVKNAKMCDMNSDFITKTFSMRSEERRVGKECAA